MTNLYIQDVVTVYNEIKDLPNETIINYIALMEKTKINILEIISILMYLSEFEDIYTIFEYYCETCNDNKKIYIKSLNQFEIIECDKCHKLLSNPIRNILINFIKKQ